MQRKHNCQYKRRRRFIRPTTNDSATEHKNKAHIWNILILLNIYLNFFFR